MISIINFFLKVMPKSVSTALNAKAIKAWPQGQGPASRASSLKIITRFLILQNALLCP